jgi:hypothetical protein
VTTPAGGTQDPGGANGAQPSPDTAVDDMRSTAKWTIAAAGAVGAALISGGPLVAIGQVHDALHAFLAAVGLVVALGGVGLAIWRTSKVLSPQLTTPAQLPTPPAQGPPAAGGRRATVSGLFRVDQNAELTKLVRQINDEPDYFLGVLAVSVADLLEQQKQLHSYYLQLSPLIDAAQDPALRAKLQGNLDRVRSDWVRVFACIRWVLSAANARIVDAELRCSRTWTMAGGVLVIIGAVIFFSVTSSGGPTLVPVLTPSPTATVTPAAVTPAAVTPAAVTPAAVTPAAVTPAATR